MLKNKGARDANPNTEKTTKVKPLKTLVSKVNIKTHLTQLPPPRNKKKKITTLIALTGIIFAGSVVFTLTRHRTSRINNETLSTLTSAGADLKEALGLVDLNNKRAHELAENAKEKLEKIQHTHSNKEYNSKSQVNDLLAKAENVLGVVSKTVTLNNLKLVYDFKIQNSRSDPTAIDGTDNTLFIVDPGAGTVYELSLTDPVTIKEIVPTTELGTGEGTLINVSLIASTESNIYILDSEGLFRVSRTTQEPEKNIVTTEYNWKNVKAIAAFASNVYLLDSANDQIIRFVGTDTGLADGNNWIAGDPDLPVPIDMAINGEIFILSQNGQMFKFSRGNRDPFNLDGLKKKLTDPIRIYTHEDLEEVYILDKENRRIVVTTTEGTYKKQYTYQDGDAWDNLKDLWVQVEAKELYVLSGTKLYKVPVEN